MHTHLTEATTGVAMWCVIFAGVPVRPAAGPTGRGVFVPVPLRDREIQAQVWVADVGRVPLVLELLAGRRDVGMPPLGLPAPRELDVALVERRVDLQEEHGLFDVQHLRHDRLTVASRHIRAAT